MEKAFLTEARNRREDRRTATCLMTVLSIAAMSSWRSARAEEPAAPQPLIARALHYAGLDREPAIDSGVLAAARWLPELRIGASVARARLPTGAKDETVVFGALSWPLDPTAVGAAADELRNDRWRLAARSDLVDRISRAWHRRTDADRLGDEVAAELDLEEADAEIDALTGAALEDRP